MTIFKLTDEMIVNGKPDLTRVPAGTTKIDMDGCTSLTSLEGLMFEWRVSARSCPSLTSVQGATFNGFADLSGCPSLTSVQGATFKGYATLEGCTSLTSVQGATFNGVANLIGCPSLTSVQGATFKGNATLEGCTSLTSVQGATFYGYAFLRGCTSLTSVQGATFKGNAILTDCTSLTSVQGATFKGNAILTDCTSLTSVQGATFKGNAILTGCTSLTSVQGATFKGNADLDGCTSLTSVQGATFNGYASTIGCTSLTSVQGATFNGNANLEGCTSLTSVQGAAFNGNAILTGCTGLIPTRELIAQLEQIEARGHEVRWPEHLSRDGIIDNAKARLDGVIARYKQSNPAGAPSTHTLFNRFLSEGLGQRDGKAAVAGSLAPLLAFIEKEPTHLEWIEEIAGHYLQGCVNQPVAGFTQISAWMKVAEAEGVAAKLEAVKQVIALDKITDYVANLEQKDKPGRGVEVEAGNALLREVHDLLVKSTMQPWPGIPGSVSYEGMVKDWLTQDKIMDATQIAATVMAQDAATTATEILGSYRITNWSHIAFAKETAAITATYEHKKEALSRMLDPSLYEGEATSDEVRKQLEIYTAQLTGKNPEELATALNKLHTNLDTDQQAEIAQMVQDLTLNQNARRAVPHDDDDDRAELQISAFINAAAKGDIATINRLLIEGVEANSQNKNGKTALIMAAQKGHSEVVAKLITANANPDLATHKNNKTPLSLAAYCGHSAVVKQLLKAGANPDLPNKKGKTPLIIAAEKAQDAVMDPLLGKLTPTQMLQNLQTCLEKNLQQAGEAILRKAADLTNKPTGQGLTVVEQLKLGNQARQTRQSLTAIAEEFQQKNWQTPQSLSTAREQSRARR